MFYFHYYLLATLKTLTSKQTQEHIKLDLNSLYANLLEYLKEHSHSNQHLKYFVKYLKMEFFNVIFIELGYQNLDDLVNTLNRYNFNENHETNEMLNDIICDIKNIETNVNASTNTLSESIKLLKTFFKEEEEEELFNKIKSIDTKSQINCYFMVYAIDLLLNYFHVLLNQQQNMQIYSQSESFLNLIANSSVLLLETTKYFFEKFQNIEDKNQLSSIKQILFKPLNQICSFERAFEYYFRSSKLLIIKITSIIIILCFI